METEPQDGVSLTVPLMHNEDLHDPTDVEVSIGDQTTSKTSFFKSCFNGLNALSGTFVCLAVSYFGFLCL